jgi:hypothetical protein
MTFVHGRLTVVKLGAKDLSAYTKNTEWSREADAHDTTAYGATAKQYNGGLLDGTVTISGTFDNTVTTGPKDSVEAIIGTNVTFIYQSEGTGSGKPQKSVTVLVKTYKQTAPVADMVSWEADLQMSGAVDQTPQT